MIHVNYVHRHIIDVHRRSSQSSCEHPTVVIPLASPRSKASQACQVYIHIHTLYSTLYTTLYMCYRSAKGTLQKLCQLHSWSSEVNFGHALLSGLEAIETEHVLVLQHDRIFTEPL